MIEIALILLAVLIGYLLGLWRRAKAVKAAEDARDVALVDNAHAKYLRERYEVQHTVTLGGKVIAVDDPEQYRLGGFGRAESDDRRVRRG